MLHLLTSTSARWRLVKVTGRADKLRIAGHTRIKCVLFVFCRSGRGCSGSDPSGSRNPSVSDRPLPAQQPPAAAAATTTAATAECGGARSAAAAATRGRPAAVLDARSANRVARPDAPAKHGRPSAPAAPATDLDGRVRLHATAESDFRLLHSTREQSRRGGAQ